MEVGYFEWLSLWYTIQIKNATYVAMIAVYFAKLWLYQDKNL